MEMIEHYKEIHRPISKAQRMVKAFLEKERMTNSQLKMGEYLKKSNYTHHILLGRQNGKSGYIIDLLENEFGMELMKFQKTFAKKWEESICRELQESINRQFQETIFREPNTLNNKILKDAGVGRGAGYDDIVFRNGSRISRELWDNNTIRIEYPHILFLGDDH